MSTTFRTPYPGYHVLEKWDTPSYNAQTRKVLAHRLGQVPPRRFFTAAEWAILAALCARVIPQPERAEPVPIAPWIDAALHDGRGTGTRYADMPEERTAWRQGLAALEAEAQARHGTGFVALAPAEQDALLSAVDQGEIRAQEAWHGLPPQRFFRHTVLKQIVSIYYVHPAAMSEIGYGGPASPRGYVRLDADRADPWEAPGGTWPQGDRR